MKMNNFCRFSPARWLRGATASPLQRDPATNKSKEAGRVAPTLLAARYLLLFFASWIAVLGSAFSSTTASFLKLGVGARALGMASAYTSIANDVTALYWNPAGLAQLEKKEVGAMHAQLFGGSAGSSEQTTFDFVGYAHPLKPSWVLGVSGAYLNQGGLEGRSASRELTGSFSANDLAVTIGAARLLGQKSSLGMSLKLLQSKIAAFSSTGFALDLGSLCLIDTPRAPLTLGLALQNIGPKMKFLDEGYNLPMTLNLGASYPVIKGILVSADFRQHVYESQSSFSMGAEFVPVSILSLRAGYITNTAKSAQRSTANFNDKLSDISGLGLGLGLNLGPTSVDYSFTPTGELGNTQRISLVVNF